MDAIFSVWSWIRWVHILSAIAWIGGQIFILLILLPIMRTALPRNERTLVFAQVGRRYAVLSWVALTLLIITGFLNGERRSVSWEHLTRSGYGQILFTKLIFVAVIIVVTLVHALYFGRRITELAERSAIIGYDDPKIAAERRRLQIFSGVLSGLNLLLNLIVVLLAAALVA